MAKEKKDILGNIVGWYGALAILGAYAAVSFGALSANTFTYQILNATGAAGVSYISLKKRVYQPAFLNITWTIVAIVAIISLILSIYMK